MGASYKNEYVCSMVRVFNQYIYDSWNQNVAYRFIMWPDCYILKCAFICNRSVGFYDYPNNSRTGWKPLFVFSLLLTTKFTQRTGLTSDHRLTRTNPANEKLHTHSSTSTLCT